MKLRILSNNRVATDVYRLVFEEPDGWGAEAGQFVMIRVNEFNYPLLRRPFSISGHVNGGICVVYRVVGEGTGMLSLRRPGEFINVIGPLGSFFEIKSTKKIVLIGGGIGTAPLLFLMEKLVDYKLDFKAFFGFNTADDVFVDVGVITTMDGSRGIKGDVVSAAYEHLDNDTVVYACGPLPMLKKLSYLCFESNAEMQVSVESRMACGIGVCLGCVIDTSQGKKRVCTEGPVFNHEEILWEKMSI